MATGRKIRPRSRRMRRGGQMPGVGSAIIKQHGGGKHGGCGFRRRAGDANLDQIVDSSGADSKIQQPSNADSASDDYIYVRGHRIQKAGLHLRIDSHGEVYVPDSEEESGMEEAEACGQDVAAGMDLAVDLNPQVHKAVGVELVPEGDVVRDGVVDQAPDVPADQAPHEGLHIKGPPVVPTNKDVPPKMTFMVYFILFKEMDLSTFVICRFCNKARLEFGVSGAW